MPDHARRFNRTSSCGRPRPALAAAVFAALALTSASAWADPPAAPGEVAVPKVAVGFSRLIVRLEGKDDIGIAGPDFRVRLLERMRADGFDAVGAENLVFGKDESRRAQFVVGGTVREVACRNKFDSVSCRVGVEWQVLDVARDAVVYTVMSRVALINVPQDEKGQLAGRLLDRSIDALLARAGFRKVLASHAAPESAPVARFPTATIPACPPGRRVADSAEDLLREVSRRGTRPRGSRWGSARQPRSFRSSCARRPPRRTRWSNRAPCR